MRIWPTCFSFVYAYPLDEISTRFIDIYTSWILYPWPKLQPLSHFSDTITGLIINQGTITKNNANSIWVPLILFPGQNCNHLPIPALSAANSVRILRQGTEKGIWYELAFSTPFSIPTKKMRSLCQYPSKIMENTKTISQNERGTRKNSLMAYWD